MKLDVRLIDHAHRPATALPRAVLEAPLPPGAVPIDLAAPRSAPGRMR
ncbi:hypothetical protein [Pseudonocardia asaccharolytica]|nr:hypothetical protein [Pseudonocardia asaccharolytica]